MSFQRIIVIGSPGSGKTTLSLALAKKLDLPVVHLDVLFWRDGWVEVSREEFDEQLAEAIKMPRFILDGNYDRTLDVRLAAADTVIYLDYPRLLCIFSFIGRVIKAHGVSRPDVGGDCPERLDFPFLLYMWKFPKRFRAKYRELLSKQTDKKVYIFKTRRAAKRFLASLPDKANAE